jgi:hypothetical protein
MTLTDNKQYGGISLSIVTIVVLGLLLAGTGALTIWLYGQYNEQRQTIDEKIANATNSAVNEQAKKDEAKYLELSKQPLLKFTGPDEFGRVTFDYPRNWNLYVEGDGLDHEPMVAYLNPGFVLPTSDAKNRFALRVRIEQGDVDTYLQTFKKNIAANTVKSSVITINGHDGTRLDGEIAKDTRGSMVVFKVDDNVLKISTDAETFRGDFDKLIQTIDFK